MKDEYDDRSYPSYEDQLLMRYGDLTDRYADLKQSDAPVVGDDLLSIDDYRYAPVEYFRTLTDLERALELAREELEILGLLSIGDEENPAEGEDGQITLIEFVYLPTWFQTAAA